MSFQPNIRYHLHKASQIKDPENLEITKAANVAPIASPADVTPQEVAEKLNDLVAALIAADLMEAS